MAPPTEQLTVLLHCRALPGATYKEHRNLRLGLQRGNELEGEVPADSDSVTFRALVTVQETAGDALRLGGPYVNGRGDERFLYVSWAALQDNGTWQWVGRMKIQLGDVPPKTIRAALRRQVPLEADLICTSAHGSLPGGTAREPYLHWRE